MKKLLCALTLLALTLPAAPRANAAELSVDLFYDSLSGGSWLDVEEYGYGWQPEIAVSDTSWRPYADGYWAYTDYGWTWVSYEDFGWATYHYGRWAMIEDYGWVWFPGANLEWGPAWVSWRFGGDYCGWAPLPPRGPEIVYDGRPIGSRVDIEFDIGPAYYNFINIRYIGEPVLRSHIYAPTYNVTYVQQTVNVTNIIVKNKVVYNYGPDYNVLEKHSARRIQRLKVERQTNVDVAAGAKTGALTKVQGDTLMIAAPKQIQRPAKQVTPPTVKAKVPKNKVERGWKGIADENTKAKLRQKFETEDSKQVPPPSGGAPERPEGATASPGPDSGASPMERGKRGRKGGRGQAGAMAEQGAEGEGATASPGETTEESPVERGKRGRKRDRSEPDAAREVAPGDESAPMGTPMGPRRGKQQKEKSKERFMPPVPPVPPDGRSPEGADSAPVDGKRQGKRARQMSPPGYAPSTGEQPAAEQAPSDGKRKARRLEPGEAPPGTAGPAESGSPYRQGGGKRQAPAMYPPQQQGGPSGEGQPAQGKPGHGKKKKGEPSPEPGT